MKTRHRAAAYFAIVLVVLVFMVFVPTLPFLEKLTSGEFLRNYLRDSGWQGYMMFVVLFLSSIPLPIPSSPLILAGGYVYGVVIGSLLSLVGMVIGASISFFLIRRFGKPLLEKMVDSVHIAHFNHLLAKRGPMIALISYAVPLFPTDAVHLILGLTKIRYVTFLGILIVGHIPRFFIMNTLGNDLHAGFTLRTAFILVGAFVFVFVAIFRKQIKHILFKELRFVEVEAVRVEKVAAR